MSTDYKRVETENTILDEIIYGCKKIVKDIVIKDQDKADYYETKEIVQKFDVYRAAVEGRVSLYYYDYITVEDIRLAIPTLTSQEANRYATNPYSMPVPYRTRLLEYLSNKTITEYEEKNDYYREITGLPPSDQDWVYLSESDIENSVIELDITKPVHQFSKEELSAIISTGILDNLIERYPECTYLRYMDKGITFYQARLADKYDILYITEDCDESILSKFQELYIINCKMAIVHTDDVAFKAYNLLYSRFIMMSNVVNTIADMISEFVDYFINREVFDIRTAEYFFSAFGVDFYRDIPLKYQKRLIRNLNRLIKYKGTKKDILSITELFGFDNITVYKYYLNKKHIQVDNEYNINLTGGDGRNYKFLGYSNLPYNNGNYEMNFIRVPLQDVANTYLKDEEAIFSYDEFIRSNGEYWNGDRTHNEVKYDILDLDFNTLITQFMSISTTTSIDEVSFEITYFFNMLLYYGLSFENMTLTIPGVDNKDSTFTLFDSFVYIFALMYMYLLPSKKLDHETGEYYVPDPEKQETIVTDPEKLAFIHGFDLYADLDQLQTDIEEMFAPLILAEQETAKVQDLNYIYYTIDTLKTQISLPYKEISVGPYSKAYIDIMENIFYGANRYVTFSKGVGPTINQVINAYITNKGIHDFIEYKMIRAQDLVEYNIYRRLYNTLMITNLNNDLFQINKKGHMTTATSYIEYLMYKCPRFYSVIHQICEDYTVGSDDYLTEIYNRITLACDCIIDYIDSEELLDIFMDLPIDTVDYIKRYMTKVIRFFASFKITIVNAASIYKLNPEKNRLIDHIKYIVTYNMKEQNRFNDSISKILASLNFRDSMRPQDRVIVKRTYKEG